MESNNVSELTNKLFAYVDALSIKLDVTATALIGIYTKQSIIDGVINLVWLIVCVLLAIWCFKQVRNKIKELSELIKKGNRTKDEKDEEDKTRFSMGLYVVMFFLSSLVAIGNLNCAISRIGNPEYHAVNNIVQDFRK